jgi:HNH endonuclease
MTTIHYRTIELGYGLCALVDEDDYQRVIRHQWILHPHDATVYARATIGSDRVYLHRLIMGRNWPHLVVDHINGKGYDCRRENLRLVTITENNRNQHPCEWHHVRRREGGWCYIMPGYRPVGRFPTAFAAALAFDRCVRAMQADESVCHFPREESSDYQRQFAELPR